MVSDQPTASSPETVFGYDREDAPQYTTLHYGKITHIDQPSDKTKNVVVDVTGHFSSRVITINQSIASIHTSSTPRSTALASQ